MKEIQNFFFFLCTCKIKIQICSPCRIVKIKGTSHESVFQILLFSTLGDIFVVKRPILCAKLIHQSSPAEMTYLVQGSQIFAVLINFSQGKN